MHRVAHGQRAKDRADGALLVDVAADENSIDRSKIDEEAALVRVEDETFEAETEVAVEKIFDVAAAAPGMIVANVTIERAAHSVAFAGTLDEIGDVEIGIVVGVREDVGAPEVHVPLVIGVPLRTRRRDRCLFHFHFAGENKPSGESGQDRQCNDDSFHKIVIAVGLMIAG